MKRFLLFLLAVAVLAGIPLYLLYRESSDSVPGQRAEEVLRLAAQKSRELESAQLTGEGRFRLEGGALPASGTVELNGVLQDAGESLQMSVSVDTLIAPGGDQGQTFRLLGAGEIVVAGRKELYFRIQFLSTKPERALFQPEMVSLLAGQWWAVTSPSSVDEGTVPGGTMTPSPNVLRAQAQVVRVVKDRGSVTFDGAPAYHYDVAIDPDKLLSYLEEVATARKEPFDRDSLSRSIAGLQATGEMWIDAQTSVLRQVTWNIEQLRTEQGMLSGSFTVQISAFNQAPPITLPADAKPFSPASFFRLQ